MRYGYRASYSQQVRHILDNPEKSKALVEAIERIRNDPSQHERSINGGVIRTDPRRNAEEKRS